MKKLLCLALVLLAAFGCLTACNFTQTMSGLKGNAESTPKVEEMMTALAEKRTTDAKALMHPQITNDLNSSLSQMSSYLNGRKASSMELININITTSTGTSGKALQEQAAYKVTLNDGAVIYLNTVYLSNNAGSGFVSFQLVLGIV